MLNDLSIQQADAVKKTNPEIVRIGVPTGTTTALLPRNDKAPFTDINVRIALQMAIDLPTIAKTYYNGTVSPNPSSLTSNDMTGWGFPYKDWPQELKDQYAYNPTKAKQLLSAAGFPNGFKTDIVADSSSDIDILQIVKSYYEQIGVNMEIRTMDTAAFTTFVRTNHAQDQMSTKGQLGVNYEPLRQLSLYVTNYPANYAMNSDPVFDAFAPAGMAATSVDQVKQILKDANDRVARQHYAVSLLAPVGFNLIQPWLNGYDGQFGSVAGSIGPAMLAFYGARFWINADLKKSMGH
jgi:ABC-type transport system substrate-binding protein